MSERRDGSMHQLPLFDVPASEAEITPRTQLRHTLALFQQRLYLDGKTEHTVSAFTSDMHLLAENLGETIPVGQITTHNLNDYLDWMEHKRGVACSRKTYARRVTTLKVFFRWLHGLGVISDDPALAVLQRSGPAPLSPILTDDELDSALQAARGMVRGEQRDARAEFLVRLLLETGIKKNEALRLTPADFEITGALSTLRVRQSSARHAHKERRLRLSPALIDCYVAYLTQYAPSKTVFTCTGRNLEYILEDISTAADLPTRMSFEILRWTCGVRDYRAGTAPESIREKLGLSPISWVETFLKIRRLSGEAVDVPMPSQHADDEAL